MAKIILTHWECFATTLKSLLELFHFYAWIHFAFFQRGVEDPSLLLPSTWWLNNAPCHALFHACLPAGQQPGLKPYLNTGGNWNQAFRLANQPRLNHFARPETKKTNLARVKKDQQNTKTRLKIVVKKIHWSKWELLHLKLSTFLIEIELLMTCFSAITIIVKYFIKWKTTLFLFILIKWESGHVWKILWMIFKLPLKNRFSKVSNLMYENI